MHVFSWKCDPCKGAKFRRVRNVKDAAKPLDVDMSLRCSAFTENEDDARLVPVGRRAVPGNYSRVELGSRR